MRLKLAFKRKCDGRTTPCCKLNGKINLLSKRTSELEIFR